MRIPQCTLSKALCNFFRGIEQMNTVWNLARGRSVVCIKRLESTATVLALPQMSICCWNNFFIVYQWICDPFFISVGN